MFEVYKLGEKEVILFALTLVRISSCMVALPIFGARTIPAVTKILLSLAITFVLFPVIKLPMIADGWSQQFMFFILRETVLGLFMGFLARIIFIGAEVAGQMLSFTMGFNAAQVMNPTFGESSSLIEQFQNLLATLLFLTINGHHIFLEALYASFELAPLGKIGINPMAMASITTMVQETFVIGIKMAGPMIAVMLFLNIAMGVIGRAVPQVNVFVTSFPINILVGLTVLMVSIPLLLTILETDFLHMGSQIFVFIKNF